MPPATTMADNSFDPFSQFGQLSLEPRAPAPGTPPPPPKTDMMMTATNAPGGGMGAGYQYQYQGYNPNQELHQQHQQQPMQISPEQPINNSAGTLVQYQGQSGQQHPEAYANYQLGQYNNPNNNQFSQQMMQQQHQQMGMTMGYHPAARMASMTSPPISPLWNNPASPGQTPPEGAATNMPNAASNIPPLPAGFDNAPAGVAGGVPPLSPRSPQGGVGAAANPFELFDTAPTAVAQAPVDPFGVGAAPAQQMNQSPSQNQERDEADFWNDMGFGLQPPQNNSSNSSGGNVTPTGSDNSLSSVTSDAPNDNSNDSNHDDLPVELDERGLPVGGDYYKARIVTPMLGAIFSSGREVRSTLYKTASNSFVDAIGDRPVISFTIDGSAANTAGICLGHVLLKVNDVEVRQTDEAVKTVGAAPRPMTMEFYVPNKKVKVVKTEGQCMVKYDNHSTEAPASACEWKPKYVVVGDMLGKPHIVYMYRSKAEYDIAVKESQTRHRALSVKVKQFDIRGAKIFHERGTIHYPNKRKWHYFTIVRGTGLPIKISASTWEDLQPVYDGVVAFLDREARLRKARMEQNRERMHMTGMYRETYY